MIKAPFNFVPLADKTYIPSWGEKISLDVPFADCLNGCLQIKISAQTPIFITDSRTAEKDTEPQAFCHTADNRYFIPATSIKGALRNVMEIISFGKMTQVQNQSFGIRDLTPGADGKFYRKKVNLANIKCGWLKLVKGQYYLDSCGTPWRISPQRLDEQYDKELVQFIRNADNFKEDANRTAKKKYEKFQGCNLKGTFSRDTELMDSGFNAAGRDIVTFSESGRPGTIVFTGQPGARKRDGGKYFEFVFPDEVQEANIAVSDITFKSFETIHQDSPDYTEFRKDELKKGKPIPVFFTLNSDNTIDAIGLSYMFKYPAYNSVYNGIPFDLLTKDNMDLCECIFGKAQGKASLKGRVQFSAAFLLGQPSFYPPLRVALSKPHPSFYPIYLGNGQSWNNETVRIAGRKRYPVRSTIQNNEATDAMTRTICPLNPQSVFVGSIRFHNLRPIELGALISAITFCGHNDCCHSLGQGKPLGFGRVRLSIESSQVKDVKDITYDIQKAVSLFTSEMKVQIPGWEQSVQLRELIAMAKGIPTGQEGKFGYMKMSTNANENQFKAAKDAYRSGEQFGSFTQILDGNVPKAEQKQNVLPNKTRVDIETALEQAHKQILEQQQKQELKRKQAELARLQMLKEQEKVAQREAARGIAEKANEVRANKQYAEAIRLYLEAASYGFEAYQAEIDICEEEMKKVGIIKNSDIVSYLETIKIASVPAFANNLKKRHSANPITQDDCPFIAKKLKDAIECMSKGDKKKWMDRKGWKPIEAILGAELTDLIFTNATSI